MFTPIPQYPPELASCKQRIVGAGQLQMRKHRQISRFPKFPKSEQLRPPTPQRGKVFLNFGERRSLPMLSHLRLHKTGEIPAWWHFSDLELDEGKNDTNTSKSNCNSIITGIIAFSSCCSFMWLTVRACRGLGSATRQFLLKL